MSRMLLGWIVSLENYRCRPIGRRSAHITHVDGQLPANTDLYTSSLLAKTTNPSLTIRLPLSTITLLGFQ